MTRVIGLSGDAPRQKRGQLAVIQRAAESEYKPIFPTDVQQLLDQEVYPSLQKFLLFWVMMDAVKVHGYIRSAMSAIGRSTVGAWWMLSKHEEWGTTATEEQRLALLEFYSSRNREWDNIKDYQNLAYKLIIGAQYLKFFGQVAFSINRNNAGQPIGFDHLPGLVVPNVDEFGYFKNPSFVQYPTKDPRVRTEFSSPEDIIYITNPDWEGSPLGGSDIEALTEFTLPLDIYLQTAAREYMKNTNRPELIYMLPQDISDEAFDTFVALLNSKYGGPLNRGRNPVAVQGELKVERIDDLPDGLPYQQSRKDARDESLAASGVSGPVLGLSDTMSSANIRESRRQFHETTMEPLFQLLEGGFYEQVHIREFDIVEWILKFNNPDFMTAVERATVHMRYIENGVLNPNEAREDLGREPREGGDEYVESKQPGGNPQGSPPEGREEEPDDPSNTGEPTDDDQDPPRGDQHDDETDRALAELSGNSENTLVELTRKSERVSTKVAGSTRDALVNEFLAWRKFAINRVQKGMRLRRYFTEKIPEDIAFLVQDQLEDADSVEVVESIFSNLLDTIQELNNE